MEIVPTVKELIESMTQEFIANNGYITCEFSTGRIKPEDLDAFVEANRSLAIACPGTAWHTFFCTTCEGYNSNHPIHCEIYHLEDDHD